jgi:hypothetical protein
LTACRRATRATDVPASNVSSTIRRFSSIDRRRLASRVSVPSRLACSDVSTYPSWTLIDVPTSGSILTYSHLVQTVLTRRLPFNKAVVLRYRLYLEDRHLAAGTINVRLAAVRRLEYEAADSGLLSPDLAAGIRRVKGAKKLGYRLGNWLTAEEARTLWQLPDPATLKGTRAICGQGASGLIHSAIETKTTPANPIFERIIQSFAPVKLWDHQRSSKQFQDASPFTNFAMRIDTNGCAGNTRFVRSVRPF